MTSIQETLPPPPHPTLRTPLPLRIGLVGCGQISKQYFQHLQPFARYAVITACADLQLDRAQVKAQEYRIPKACSLSDLLNDPEIDLILNLTLPESHFSINLQALSAGKHAYCEKPFALTVQEGLQAVSEARKQNLRLGCAPDTVLGGGIQTCRKLIDDGAIGTPLGATANMLARGHEHWHPNPAFYYQPGGGPLYDMGPYYLTALVTLLGPISRVSAVTRKSFAQRTITSQPLYGQKIDVHVPTHILGLLEFNNGAIANMTMSFDVFKTSLPRLEIYGTEGSLSCPDPNTFGGLVQLFRKGRTDWEEIPPTHRTDVGRGLGIADLAHSLVQGKLHRQNDTLALHVQEAMESFQMAADSGCTITLQNSCTQPEPLPAGLALGNLDS